ncbi:hypothetical protein HMPREF0063_12187 [Aeromicrobium marinum DSM 15272]|uniref:DUF559 domain-containing protein n=1 Tax=Aeromicrobium marinum DSM 15272 TaxID=585531 RepID=E2SCM5_9ACTN|nr:hypothetical protein [Aeromicrobium marinum]EFQ82978.1 hypothetical protein HMPREF0063_12187 [Aeromicrobium marinum DSM 15272]
MEPILTREAELHGVSLAVLRGPDFTRPAAGVALHASRSADLPSRCRAVAKVLPADAVFTHLTSARLRQWWLPTSDDLPLIACTDGEAPHHDRRGVYVRRCAIPPAHRQMLGDLAVASAAWTIVELAEHLSLVDLVVVVDGALHLGHTTVDEIRATMVRGRRGVRSLRRAIELCDGRSESAWETILRLIHVMAGIDVEPQTVVCNRAGVAVARGDLLILGTRRIAEYDGASHRDRRQHEDDLRRDKALARAGYERYGYIAREVVGDPARVVRDADEARGVPHDPARVLPWLREVAESSLSARGSTALARRLARFVRTTTPRPSGAERRPSGAE